VGSFVTAIARPRLSCIRTHQVLGVAGHRANLRFSRDRRHVRAGLARHRIDEDLPLGVHQDATAVNPEVPCRSGFPSAKVAPRQHSARFIVPSPVTRCSRCVNDVGVDYVLGNLEKVWVPHYKAGDLTIHSAIRPLHDGLRHAIRTLQPRDPTVGAEDHLKQVLRSPLQVSRAATAFPW